jgi:hypothetical protein
MCAWRVSEPEDTTEVPTGAGYIRENWASIEAVLTSARLIAGTEIKVPIVAGTKMIFYADTAPTDWTLDATPSDELLAIKGGTTYTTGGATAGTWQQIDATLTTADIPDHTHVIPFDVSANSGSGGQFWCSSTTNVTSGSSVAGAGTATHNHGLAWRPAARVCIICSYDG